MPQSDPIGPPAPSCPNIGPIVRATAVVKHEPPGRTRLPVPPSVLDIELTVVVPPNPDHVTLAPNRVTIFGGVLIEERFQRGDPDRDIVLIRPMGAVGPEASLMALFGVVCKEGQGSLRVPMSLVNPWRAGDTVSVRGILSL
jgi:hypothetical protein